MFENAAIGIALLDDEGRIVEANPALRDMTGYEAGELLGRHYEEISHPDDHNPDLRHFDALVAGRRDRYQLQKRYVRKGGESFWGRWTASRLEGGQEERVVGMVEDIDEQKQYENSLKQAKEEAERMNRLKSAFLANMSHEIRTPLTSIIGFAEAIGDQVNPDEDEGAVPRFARLIEKSGRRLMGTLTGVLNLSRLEAGELSLSTNSVDLSEEVREMVEHYQPQAEKNGIDLRARLETEPVHVKGDTEGLRIILRNLVSNALKYTEEGGRARVRARQSNAEAVLEVEDTGIGMDPDEVPDLFEAFTQASNGIGREYEGSGLGLAVTKQVVDKMDGAIEVDTEQGNGSCFTICLPKPEDAKTETAV
jgi:PAS domain S-box-containing protein